MGSGLDGCVALASQRSLSPPVNVDMLPLLLVSCVVSRRLRHLVVHRVITISCSTADQWPRVNHLWRGASVQGTCSIAVPRRVAYVTCNNGHGVLVGNGLVLPQALLTLLVPFPIHDCAAFPLPCDLQVLTDISQRGIDKTSILSIGTKYISEGSFGNGGAMRIAPLGLVYR